MKTSERLGWEGLLRWLAWMVAIAWFLFAVSRLHAQTLELPPAAAYYELGVFRPAVSLTTPFTTTRVTLAMLSCGRLPREEAPDNAPNPTGFQWMDPNDATKVCLIDAPTVALSLPLAVGYRAAVRAVAENGSASGWVFAPTTFRRAPRGLPCPNGQPGVLFTGENDIDGKPVRLTICVSQ